MCGISGLVFTNNNLKHKQGAFITNLSKAIAHRGPDGEGYCALSSNNELFLMSGDTTPEFLQDLPFKPTENIHQFAQESKVLMAHRRLSIVDLNTTGHQPMCDDSKQFVLIFNGEIFNQNHLRSRLQQLGVEFKGTSDTEVLLQAYIKWGADMLQELNGFFSFVLLDIEKQMLFGARDYNGVKPFYYTHHSDFFAWASEPKALLTLPISKQLNDRPVFNYLVNSQIDVDQQHFISSIQELSQGHSFTYCLRTHQFEISSFTKTNFPSTSEQALNFSPETLKNHISNAISQRLITDVPYGFSVSGGLDSSIIIAEAAALNPSTDLHLFSANNQTKGLDESKWQEILVNFVGGSWHKTNVKGTDFVSHMHELIHIQDAPLLSYNNFAHYQLLQTVKNQGIKVLFNGQGADELFAGYPHYYLSWFLEQSFSKRVELFTHFHHAPLSKQQFIKWYIRHLFQTYLPSNWVQQLAKTRKPWLQVIDKDFLASNSHLMQAHTPFKAQLNEALSADYYGQKLREMLHWEDRSTMAFGIEARNPFADDITLAQYALQIPSELKIYKGYSKHILRKAYEHMLPSSICYRTDKLGYSMPDIEWNKANNASLKAVANELESDYVDKKLLLKNWDKTMLGNQLEEHKMLFRAVNFMVYEQQQKP
jgi:asparagine synthase (glutamine-hydrolysing)